jgi:hypothetical protein
MKGKSVFKIKIHLVASYVRVGNYKYLKLHSLAGEKGEVEWKLSSLAPWFLFLLLLNVLDVLVTNPAYESNPFTLYIWGQIGIFLSAWIKIGLVLFFGVLCASAKKFSKPAEWVFARKALLGILIVLVAFYIFVVTWNVILFVSFPLW